MRLCYFERKDTKKNPFVQVFVQKKQRSASRLDLCFGSMHVERNLVVNADELIFAIEFEFEAGIEFCFPAAVVFAPLGNERVGEIDFYIRTNSFGDESRGHFGLLAINFEQFACLVELQRTVIVELDIVLCVQQAFVQCDISDL